MSSEGETKRPHGSAFKQQQLPAWTPILTPKVVITTFLIVGVIFIPLGILFLSTSQSVVEASVRYDESCGSAGTCEANLIVDKDMTQPVYMYYQLHNFYQNHRRYVKSRSDAQLRGDDVSLSSAGDCEPMKTDANGDLLNPCGLIANSKFNDTLELATSTGTNIALKKTGIAWKSDVEKKFKEGTPEDLIVWMRTAGLPNFKKLYAIIEQDIPAGNYTVNIGNNYDVKEFSGKKYVVLSTTKWLGGKNDFLGIAYITVGSLCVFLAVAFGIKHSVSPRKIGDTKWLIWHKSRRAD